MKLSNVDFQRLYLIALTLFAVLVRISRFEIFKIYTDSYKYLLIANATFNGKWISDYYPTFLQFTDSTPFTGYKWLFGIIIGVTSRFLTIGNVLPYTQQLIEQAAQIVIVLSAVAGLFLLYKTLQRLAIKRGTILILVTLFAFSGAHIIWSGFIITDTFAVAIILMLIYILCLKTDVKSITALLSMSVLMYFTRVELGIAAVAMIVLKNLLIIPRTAILLKERFFQMAMFFANLIFLAVLLLNTFSGTLIRSIFQADLLLWVLLFTCAVWAVASSLLKIVIDDLPKQYTQISFIIKLVASLMMMVYYIFNKAMGRYVLLVLPYFYVIVAIELDSMWLFVEKRLSRLQVLKPIFISGLALLFAFQCYFTFTFPKYALPDYHTEVSTEVINLLDQSEQRFCHTAGAACSAASKPALLIAQQDPFLWANFNNHYEVLFLSKSNYDIMLRKIEAAKSRRIDDAVPVEHGRAYFFEDNSLQYKDAYFSSENLSLLKEVTRTKSQFRVNDIKEDGWYRVWYAEW